MKMAKKRAKSLIFPVTILVFVGMILFYFGIRSRWFRAPFPIVGKNIAWMIGLPEQAYNFDVVVPEKLYRSGKPDDRFIRYIHEKYGIENIISLTGDEKAHETAETLGMKVLVYSWSPQHLPPKNELETVIDFIQKHNHTLVHCAGGSDRTGYAVAFYRIWRQHWKPENALKEMNTYWHKPEKKKALHREIAQWLQAPTD